MSGKVVVSVLLLIAIIAAPSNAFAESRAETTAKPKPTARASQATEAARRLPRLAVLVETSHKSRRPEHQHRFFGIRQARIQAVLHFLGTVITRILEFLRSLMPSWIPRLPVSGATSGLTWAFAALARGNRNHRLSVFEAEAIGR